MTTFNIKALAVAVALTFSVGVMAQGISKSEYKSSQEKISLDYKAAKAACNSFSDNANDICMAQATGNEKVALAELEASYKPNAGNHYKVSVARAEANYDVAKQRCDDQAGTAKDVCVKEAKAAQTSAKADAKAQMKTTEANVTANEKTDDARDKAGKESTAARKEATTDKLDADYSVAKAKCDTYSGAAKDTCLDQAKIHFGKS